LLVSVVALLIDKMTRSESAPTAAPSWSSFLEVARLMFPVATLYMTNNCLVFLVIAHVRLDAYAVWRNLSILFNALIWVSVLQRHIDFHRWIAVITCMIGSCYNSLGADGSFIIDAALGGVLLTAFLSSLASVCNERVIKCPEAQHLDINQINILLYGQILCIMFVLGVGYWLFQGAPVDVAAIQETFSSLTPGAWKIISLQVTLGLCVSRVLKHADAVAKTVVGSLRDVAIVFVAPHLVVGTRYDAIAVGSACLVGVAGMIYSVPPPKAKAEPPVPPPLPEGRSQPEPEADTTIDAKKL